MQDADLWTLPGIGGELQDIYMQTAQIPDLRFSWAAVVSLFSVICSRRYRTPSRNYTPVSMMILARSSSGKNHILSFVSECLKQSGLSHLIIDPTGCSSKQGLFGILKRCPSQIIIIDESGHSRQANKGDGHAIALRGSIMSIVSNAEGSFSLPATSERGLSENDKAAKREYEKPIQHPGLTCVEISTSEKLLKQVSPEEIDSGELGRYILLTDNVVLPVLAESDPPKIDLHDNIRQTLSTIRYDSSGNLTEEQAYEAAKEDLWQARAYVSPDLRLLLAPSEDDVQKQLNYLVENDPGFISNNPDNPDRPPVPVVFEWEDPNMRNDIFLSRQRELLEKYWATGNSLHSKQHEHGMRLSLIYSLMDTDTRERRIITREHAQKAMQVINHLIEETDKRIVPQIACSDVQRATKVAVEAIKAADGKPVGYDAWKTKSAWKNLDSSQKKMSVLDSLQDYPIIAIKNENNARKGRFNNNLYAWVEDGDDLEKLYSEFEKSRQEAEA